MFLLGRISFEQIYLFISTALSAANRLKGMIRPVQFIVLMHLMCASESLTKNRIH